MTNDPHQYVRFKCSKCGIECNAPRRYEGAKHFPGDPCKGRYREIGPEKPPAILCTPVDNKKE